MTASSGPKDATPMTVVTGGSEGIGYALAARAAARGERVLLVARRPGQLATAAAAIPGSSTLALDVTAPDALAKLDAALASHGAYCDRLINSAGMGLGGEFLRHAPADLDRLVALNIGALTQLTRHMLPGMIARRRGMILNLASLGGYAPGPYQAAYYASKAYVLSFTEAVAHEVQGRGVVVAVASPGPVRTAFHERMNAQRGLYLKTMPVPSAEATARRIERQLAWGRRVITPGLVPTLLAPAMRVLPHPVSNYIIGTLLKP